MSKTISEQLRFPSVSGMSVRAAFDDGALSSDFGALLLAGVDRQMGLTERLTVSFTDRRHASYVDHALADLLKQRIYQQASAYEDCNDAGVSEPKVFVLDMDHTDDPTYGQQQFGFYNHHRQALQNCRSRCPVQGSHQAAPPVFLSGKRHTGSDHRDTLLHPTAQIRVVWTSSITFRLNDSGFSLRKDRRALSMAYQGQ